MSKINELVLDIQSDIADGIMSFGRIAELHGVSRADVEAIADEMMEQDAYDDSMDGDHESALASAGFGTDEDYGYYGDE